MFKEIEIIYYAKLNGYIFHEKYSLLLDYVLMPEIYVSKLQNFMF